MPTKFDENGVRYIIGFYTKGDGWFFCPHSFEITNPKRLCSVLDNSGIHTSYVRKPISGQFITSSWFSTIYDIGDVQQYMLLGIKGKKTKRDEHIIISKMINSYWPAPCLINALTKEELDFGIEFKDIYILDENTSKELMKEKNVNERKNVILHGKYGLSEISICSRLLGNNKLYMTLPDFKITC